MARWPWQSKREVVMPSRSSGTKNAETPRAPAPPVRANTMAAADWSAAEIDVFSPLSTYWSPSSVALSTRLAASEPPRGSVNASASMISPAVSRCSHGVTIAGSPWSSRICAFSEPSRLM